MGYVLSKWARSIRVRVINWHLWIHHCTYWLYYAKKNPCFFKIENNVIFANVNISFEDYSNFYTSEFALKWTQSIRVVWSITLFITSTKQYRNNKLWYSLHSPLIDTNFFFHLFQLISPFIIFGNTFHLLFYYKINI